MDWAREGCQEQSQELINESPALWPLRAWEITSPTTPLPSRPFAVCVLLLPSVCSAVYEPVYMRPSGEAQNSNQSPCGGALEVAQFNCPWSCMPVASLGGVLP